MRITRSLLAIGLAALAMVSMFLFVQGGELIDVAYGETAWRVQEITPTIYLPLIMYRHLSGYDYPFGIVMYGDVDDAAGLGRMGDAGSKWVTTKLNWSEVEYTEDSYDWSSFDAKAQQAHAVDMDVFVLFTGNPSWAAQTRDGPVTDTQDLVDFATDMAERYDCDGVDDADGHPCVHYWSFYAEPDLGTRWGYIGSEFAAMLSQVSPAIHAANPRAKVLIGGLAYDWFEEDGGPFVRSFLTDTLSALNGYSGGAGAYIDAMAFHFYPISDDRWLTIREKALEVQGIMESHGVGDLPLICPEMGYWSAEEVGWSPSSEQQQARRLVQMYVRGLSVGLEHMSWFAVFDGEVGTANEHGLFWNHDLNDPKQSYYAYQTLTQELAWARYLEPLQATDAEGYVFRTLDGSSKKVLWATASSTVVSFYNSCLRMVDTLGNEYYPITDGLAGWDEDGRVNGEISLRVYEDTPFYVEPCH